MDIKKIPDFFKNKNNIILFIILIIGVIFMLFSSRPEKSDLKSSPVLSVRENNDSERLKGILTKIKGVGDAEVMITYYGGNQTQIAYDTNSTKTKRGDGNEIINTEENTSKQAIMSSGEPYIKQLLFPEVKGVVIVADGAGDINVKAAIQNAAVTALGIAPHKVCVLEKK